MKPNKEPENMITKFNEFYKKNPWNSAKFVDIAEKAGYDRNEAKQYLKTEIVHDQRKPIPKFIPIVSSKPGGWQMDTFINQKASGGLNFLMFININTRKARAYPMHGKGKNQVLAALDKFIQDEPSCRSIASDQDAAYLSNDVLEWMDKNEINFTTTTDDNHNNLGIINRFMRTIRDMAVKRGLLDEEMWDHLSRNGNLDSDFTPSATITEAEMAELIDSYNGTPHRSIGKSPNNFTKEDEIEYIKTHKKTKNPYNFKEGDKVRIVEEKNKLGKNRFSVSHRAYTVDSRSGNLFNVVSKDKSSNAYPGYRLVKAKGKVPYAESLKEGKRGNIVEIKKYIVSSDKYQVKYEGGVEDTVPARDLREGRPTKLSRMEREYWLRHKPIPEKIRKWF